MNQTYHASSINVDIYIYTLDSCFLTPFRCRYINIYIHKIGVERSGHPGVELKMTGFKCQNKTKYMQVNAELILEFNV